MTAVATRTRSPVLSAADSLVDIAASTGGGSLAAATWVLGRLPGRWQPLHPSGRVITGRVTTGITDEHTGAQWLDQSAEWPDVLVRISTAVGLPFRLPDIRGLAFRIPLPGGPADILLASTGLGLLSRYVLVPRRTAEAPLTSLLPYRSPTGPLVLGARPDGSTGFELLWARPAGGWRWFGYLDLAHGGAAPDQPIRFDPVVHLPPGLTQYDWVRRLREPAYVTARRGSA